MAISTQLGDEHEVRLPAGPVRWRERGEGRPVVFIHGFLVNGDLWRGVVPRLPDGLRCITPDWPLGSHTAPMQPDADLTPPGLARLIADFLEALDLRDVVLVGNDTGGALAQLVVTRHPERVGALVLTPCDAFWNFPAWWSKPLRPIGFLPGLMAAVGRPLRSERVRRLPLVYGWVVKRPFPPAIAASYVEPGLRDPAVRRDFGKGFRSASPRHTRAAAKALPGWGGPALVVWSTEQTRIYPQRHGRRLAELLGAPLELVDDSYIYVPEDRPERLAEILADFIGPA